MKQLGLLAAILAATAVSLAVAAAPAGGPEEKARIAGLEEKYEELEGQQKLIETEIGKARTEREKQLAAIQQLALQIDTTEEQIRLLDERIAQLEGYIGREEILAEEKQREVDARYESFKSRLNAMARLPQISGLGVVLGTDSYYDFIVSEEILSRAAMYDRRLLEELKQEKAALDAARKGIERSRNAIEEDKARIAEKKQELGYRLAQAQKQVQDIALLEQQFLANQEALNRQMKQVQAEIDDIYAEIARKSELREYVGGGKVLGSMMRPTPDLTQITSAYGWRFGNSNFHTGTDFSGAGAYGHDIVAANAGKVAFVNTAFTPGYGYGKYVIIDHGGGITTLYGHCSAIDVQVGQVVAKGETIAKVGSTGWSTGPHCHFEVRVDGKHTNPMPYLEGS